MFNGKGKHHKVEDWFATVHCFKNMHNINDADAIYGLQLLLKDEAAEWWSGVKENVRTWAEFELRFRSYFAPKKPSFAVYMDIFAEQQAKNEPTENFICRKRALLSKLPYKHDENIELDLLFGLLKVSIQKQIPRDSIETFEQLLTRARTAEQYDDRQRSPSPQRQETAPALTSQNKPSQGERKKKCTFCKNNGHTEDVCRKKKNSQKARESKAPEPTKTNVSCYGCGAMGYFRSNCPKCCQTPRLGIENIEFYSINTTLGRDVPTLPVIINGNLGIAHIDTGARTTIAGKLLYNQLIKQGCKFENVSANVTLADGSTRQQAVQTTFCKIIVGGRAHQMRIATLPEAIDNRTLIGIDFLEQAGITLNCPQRAWCFSDNPTTQFRYDVDEKHGPNQISKVLPITNQNHRKIVKNNWSMTTAIQVANAATSPHLHTKNPQKRNFTQLNSSKPNIGPEAVFKVPIGMPRKQTRAETITSTASYAAYVTPLAPIVNAPRCQQIAPRFNTDNLPKPEFNETFMQHTNSEQSTRSRTTDTSHSTPPSIFALYAEQTASTPDKGEIERILKMHTKPMPSFLSPIPITPEAVRRNEPTPPQGNEDIEMENCIPNMFLASIQISLRNDEAAHLSSVEQAALNKILAEHSCTFKTNKKPTSYAEHSINTGNSAPIATTPYRMTPEKRQKLRDELDKMLENNIIEDSESPWAAPVVMIPKKDGKIRVCIDYRQLNAVTTADRYPLPRIDDLLHEAKSSGYMTTMDLQSGYWQIAVNATDQEKTAFIRPFGLFQFTRMPFGLKNAPATFQRMMNRFKNGLTHISILVYLDDIIIRSETFDQHIRDLNDVFLHLKQFNLQANREKCRFCCSEVKFLGHIITKNRLATDPEKTAAIALRTKPKNIKQLLSFVQTCS